MGDDLSRKRLQKADRKDMVAFLRNAGLEVNSSADRVDVFDPDTRRYLGGFYWEAGDKTRPNGWRFDIALAEVFSVKDFHNATSELLRVQRLFPRMWAAWKAYSSSKSDKRWTSYRSFIAAIFLRQDTE